MKNTFATKNDFAASTAKEEGFIASNLLCFELATTPSSQPYTMGSSKATVLV